jgi:hypothetical protein
MTDFSVSTGPVSAEDAQRCAADLERVLGEIANGTRKPNKIPMEPILRLIQFARQPQLDVPLTPEIIGRVLRATARTLTDPQIDDICGPGRALRWKHDGRQYDRDTVRLVLRTLGGPKP